jgi:hypothetical protein
MSGLPGPSRPSMRRRLALVCVPIFVLTACATSAEPPTSSPVPDPNGSTGAPSPNASLAPSPSAIAAASFGPLPSPWALGPSTLDYPGGGAEVVAEQLGVPPTDVAAAAVEFDHPEGNGVSAVVFRAAGMSGRTATARLAASFATCGPPPETATLAGAQGLTFQSQGTELCYPEYILALDLSTAVWLSDDGGWKGPPQGTSTVAPIRFRSVADIATLVAWLEDALPDLMFSVPAPEGSDVPGPT